MMDSICNSTLEEMRISPGSEVLLVGPLTFHDLARVIAGSCTVIAVLMSLFLVWMHALNYTRPREQRHIIRILLMVPVYAISSYLQIQWHWHAIYFQVISDCYEAFAIASFFALLCHYVAPDLHAQKAFFREMRPIKPWVWPVNWFAKCCVGQKGPWRTPKSGLTWFNIVWVGIYHYCFIRVAMTISAVVSQYFDRYCESSNLPVFAHIWVLSINALAVTIAMFCLVQFYVQLRESLAEYRLFVKIVAIKLVVFLSFWQATCISIGTSTLNIVHPSDILAYPDLKVGIPALLLCIEMACFAIMHIWAFPYAPYVPGAPDSFYPVPDPDKASSPRANQRQEPSGGFAGLSAILDALNLWDFVKAFGRGMRWLFCGVKRRKDDVSYKLNRGDVLDMDTLSDSKERTGTPDTRRPRPEPVPQLSVHGPHASGSASGGPEEIAGLMDHAQPNPEALSRRGSPSPAPRTRGTAGRHHSHAYHRPFTHAPRQDDGLLAQQPHYHYSGPYEDPQGQATPPEGATHAQAKVGEALWGPR